MGLEETWLLRESECEREWEEEETERCERQG
jgi:hypothetical protein